MNRSGLGDPHVDVIRVVEHQQPLACAFSAQVPLHQSFHVLLVVLPSRYVKLLRSVEVCLVQAFLVGCWYPDDGAAGMLVFCSEKQLEHELRLPYAAETHDSNLCGTIVGEQHSFQLGKLRLTACEARIPLKRHNPGSAMRRCEELATV